MRKRISSGTTLKMLLEKHSKDLCIPECKTGSTWFSNKLFKLDLWVMKRSWAHPNTYGYEIKVSRSDFIQDDKWNNYLRYCSDFYFVAPPGTIDIKELPKEVGLLITSVNGKRLYCKKKAVSRLKVEIPEGLFRYILMWRSVQKEEREMVSKKEYWKEWVKNKEIDHRFGRMVSKAIKKKIDELIRKVQDENNILKAESEGLKEIRDLLLELKFTPVDIRNRYYSIKSRLAERIEKVEEGEIKNFKEYLKETVDNLQNAISIIEKEK